MQCSNENDYNECDIVAVTPEKGAKKKIKKRKLPKLILTNHQDDQLLEDEFWVTRNQYELLRLDNHCMNEKYKLPFIFFGIKEILKASAGDEIFNLNIKLIGIYLKTSTGINYLTEFMKNDPVIIPQRIKLNMGTINTFPVIKDLVEMYGILNFDQQNLLTFNVKFWLKISTDIDKYQSCLQWQRGFIPWDFQKMDNCKEDQIQDYSSIINKTSYAYDEIDESWLNSKTAELENIIFEIQQLMNIDQDIFL